MLETRILASFARQGLMTTFGATLTQVTQGNVEITAPILPLATQQHGAGHAGLTFALADSAAGYAALTMMDEGREVMTVEAKINLMAPATGDWLIARGKVIRAGRRLTVVQAEVFAIKGENQSLIALLQATMIPVDPA
jgi:uncharacterized protein (TIGR00369 family)